MGRGWHGGSLCWGKGGERNWHRAGRGAGTRGEEGQSRAGAEAEVELSLSQGTFTVPRMLRQKEVDIEASLGYLVRLSEI